MRCLPLALAVIAVAAGCAPMQMTTLEKVSGDANEVEIKAGNSVNPGPLAMKHCATYGKSAILVRSQPVEGSTLAGIYYFACRITKAPE